HASICLVFQFISEPVCGQIGLQYPLAIEPVQILVAEFAGESSLPHMRIHRGKEIVGRCCAIGVLPYKVRHHVEKRLALSGLRIGKEKMRHSKYKGPLAEDQRLISPK